MPLSIKRIKTCLEKAKKYGMGKSGLTIGDISTLLEESVELRRSLYNLTNRYSWMVTCKHIHAAPNEIIDAQSILNHTRWMDDGKRLT